MALHPLRREARSVMVAALFVARGGCYFGLPDVDPWPVERDARLYAGPWPVIAHPPCKRWGRFWYGDPLGRKRYRKGDDGGCFAAALEAVRCFGGVLEHPAESAAWRAFGLRLPATGAGWIPAEPWFGRTQGWTCEVDQAHFGHRARKPTWLYAVGCALPELPREPFYVPDPGGKSKRGMIALMSHKERDATPPAFRDLLLGMARSVPQRRCA